MHEHGAYVSVFRHLRVTRFHSYFERPPAYVRELVLKDKKTTYRDSSFLHRSTIVWTGATNFGPVTGLFYLVVNER